MNTEHLLLCLFPISVIVLMLFGVKFTSKNKFHEDFLSLESTKIIQGLAAIGVIMHHCVQIITDYGTVWLGPISIFNDIGVLFTAIFFFCSGFGLIISYRTKPDYLKGFMRKRIPAVLIPFIISNILYFVIIGLYYKKINSVIDVILYLTGIKLINRNTWFLIEIMVLYLAFYFIFRFVKKEKAKWVFMSVFIMLMIIISLLLGHETKETRGFWFLGQWWYNTTLLFPVGMVVARYKDKIVGFAKKHYVWLLPLFTILFMITLYVTEHWIVEIFGYYQEWEGHPGYWEKAVTALAHNLTCFFFVGMVLLVTMKIKIQNILLRWLGKISLEMYIVHDLFRQHLMNGEADVSNVMFLVIVLGGSVVVAVLMYMLDRKLIKGVTK